MFSVDRWVIILPPKLGKGQFRGTRVFVVVELVSMTPDKKLRLGYG